MHGEDEAFLPPSSSPARRVLPYVGAFAVVFTAGMGSHSMLTSGHVSEAVTLSGHDGFPWYRAWRSRPSRLDSNGCTWDGDDCRDSKCCSKPGSHCWVKNHHWASCNETCSPYVHWQGHHDRDRRGFWVATHHPVWQCLDITRAVVQTVPTTVVPDTPALPPVPTTVPTTKAPPGLRVHDREVSRDGGEISMVSKTYPKEGESTVARDSSMLPKESSDAADVVFVAPPTV